MAIDFSKFIEKKEVILPIVNKVGKINSRVIKLGVEDGWYKVELGNQPKIIKKATQLDIFKALKPLKKIKAYAFGNEAIPLNFDNINHDKPGESIRVNFLEQATFNTINIVLWEDSRYYFVDVDSKTDRNILTEMKKALEANQNIFQIKGITPELRYYYLLNSLQKQTLESIEKLKQLRISQEEMRKRMAELRDKIEFRVKDSIEKAGGRFVRLQKRGEKYLVVWRVGDQEVKSIIKDDLRIDSAGFCLSGEDKKHSLNSIVNLAKLFKRTDPLYITRE